MDDRFAAESMIGTLLRIGHQVTFRSEAGHRSIEVESDRTATFAPRIGPVETSQSESGAPLASAEGCVKKDSAQLPRAINWAARTS